MKEHIIRVFLIFVFSGIFFLSSKEKALAQDAPDSAVVSRIILIVNPNNSKTEIVYVDNEFYDLAVMITNESNVSYDFKASSFILNDTRYILPEKYKFLEGCCYKFYMTSADTFTCCDGTKIVIKNSRVFELFEIINKTKNDSK